MGAAPDRAPRAALLRGSVGRAGTRAWPLASPPQRSLCRPRGLDPPTPVVPRASAPWTAPVEQRPGAGWKEPGLARMPWTIGVVVRLTSGGGGGAPGRAALSIFRPRSKRNSVGGGLLQIRKLRSHLPLQWQASLLFLPPPILKAPWAEREERKKTGTHGANWKERRV